jgi:hypothetical protein
MLEHAVYKHLIYVTAFYMWTAGDFSGPVLQPSQLAYGHEQLLAVVSSQISCMHPQMSSSKHGHSDSLVTLANHKPMPNLLSSSFQYFESRNC